MEVPGCPGRTTQAWGPSPAARSASETMAWRLYPEVLIAWALVPSTGWTGGSWVPLVLDAGAVAAVGMGLWAFRIARDRRMAEARVAESMEGASGMAPGTLNGPLELARGIPSGVSTELAERAAADALDRLRSSKGGLEGVLGSDVRRWNQIGYRALAVVMPLLILAAVALGGCATGSGGQVSAEQEKRNEAAWKRAEAHGN